MNIKYCGVDIELEKLPNGKYKKPDIAQFTKSGRGCTWLDDCRVPIAKGDEPHGGYGEEVIGYGPFDNKGGVKWQVSPTADKGRFPANLVVSDDILNDGEDHIGFAGQTHMTEFNPYGGNALNSSTTTRKGYVEGFDKSGSFSRFFSLDAWWNKHVSNLPEEVRKVFPFLICPKAAKSEKNKGLEDNMFDRECRWNNAGEWQNLKTTGYGNNHPTVKPIKLMSYLVALGSRRDDIVLDPFMGSGTTCVAAKMSGRKYIGIELNKDYYAIAEKRIDITGSPMI
jgi:site-specific DNA-methyltransferase (adenine-specific)